MRCDPLDRPGWRTGSRRPPPWRGPVAVALWVACVVGMNAQESVPPPPEAALEAALEAGDVRGLDHVLAEGAPVNTVLPCGERPLLKALRLRRNDLVSVCLDWCANWRAATAGQPDALTLAVVTQNTEAAAMLLGAGADPNHLLSAPVPAAVREKFSDIWFGEQLRTDPGLTPLMLAVVLGDEPLVKLLLEHGGRPNQRTRRFTTDAVNLACNAGQIRVAQILLGRDPDCPTNQRLVVSLGQQRVTLFRGDEFVLSSRCSTGRKGYATRPGEYLITTKLREWVSTIYKVPMPWMMRLNSSAIGLHQGVVPGYPASHGCIRLPAGKAASIFKIVRVGDRVEIVP